jgi:hypothetical protein
MKNTLIGLVVCLSLFAYFSQEFVAYSEDYMPVDYCELIKNPSLYDGKKVRVEATYRYGFEWSELYCQDCFELNKRTWVEFNNLDESCTSKKSLKKLRKDSPKGRTLSVVFSGTFESAKKSYGHSNGYQFQLNVSCVEKAKVLLEDSPLPTATSNE